MLILHMYLVVGGPLKVVLMLESPLRSLSLLMAFCTSPTVVEISSLPSLNFLIPYGFSETEKLLH